MISSNVNSYVDYFRQLAVRHNLLRHNPDSETGDASASTMHFAKWNLNELIGSLRTKCSFPALLLELYETQANASIVYDIKLQAKGAITILQHVKEGDVRAEEPAYALTEKIMYDLLKQIWQDHYGENNSRCSSPFFKFDFNTLDITSTGKILQNEYGWRVEFSFQFQNAFDITVAPEAGIFL